MLCLILLLSLATLGRSLDPNLEQCFPMDNVPIDDSAQLEDRVDPELDPTDVENYIQYCAKGDTAMQEVKELVRATSETCTEFPVYSGDDNCDFEPSTRYGFSEEKGQCIPFQFSGCGANDNNFVDLVECQQQCEDPCNLPLDQGERTEPSGTTEHGRQAQVQCEQFSGIYYYHDKTRGTCSEFQYYGCGGNRNRFESLQECHSICDIQTTTVNDGSAPSLAVPLSNGRLVRHKRLVKPGDLDIPSFCAEFTQTFPEMVQVIDALGNITSPDIEQDIIEELDRQVACTSEADPTARKKRGLLSFLTRPLRWARATIINNNNCKRIRVRVRIFCMSALWNGPTPEQRAQLCELMKQGIKKHWEVDILNSNGGVDWPVTVDVEEGWLFSKKVVLKYFTSPPSNPNVLRSFNLGFPWLPMWMKYRGYAPNDLAFMETAAHELGHDVLKADGGLIWSWTHEGTSTLFQNTHSGTPAVPTAPQDINLMWYHDGGDFTNYYNRVKASQSQISALINHATFRFTVFWCPGAIGSPCFSNSHCNPPGICSWFRCVNCNQDTQCPANQFCRGRFNPFIINTCVDRRPIGAFCTRDAMCLSEMCDGGRCVECETDSDCASNEWCRWTNIPLVLNDCTPKKPDGSWCLRDGECVSGMCDGARCVPCQEDSDCPNGWCKYKDVPLVVNECKPLIGNGGWCLRDSQCVSGMCDGARCVECEQHSHCASNQFCKNKDLPLILNKCTNKKCKGWCTKDIQCLSGDCKWYLRCKKC